MKNTDRSGFLEFLPVSIFGSVMGLSALSFAWTQATRLWGASPVISQSIGLVAIIVFLLLLVCYSLKTLKYPELVKKEFDSAATNVFFSTITTSLLLIPGVLLPFFPVFAAHLWLTATVLTLLFSWYILRQWLDKSQNAADAMPAWFLPIMGTLNVPIAGTKVAIPGGKEICLISFSIGIVFAVILLAIIVSRLIFQTPVAEAARPTLMILVAPAALVFSSYRNLIPGQDMFGAVLIYFDLFLLLVLSSKLLIIHRSCPFYVSWWAVSFPLGALASAVCRFVEKKPGLIPQYFAKFLLIATSLVILFLLVQTIVRIVRKTFVPITLMPVKTVEVIP